MSCETTFNRVMSEVQLRLPGAIDNVLKVELFAVLDEFFRNTHIWQESIPFGVVASRKTYDIDSNEWIAVVHELMYVLNKDGVPVNATMPEAGTLALYNYPPEDQTYTVRVALATADVLDDDGYPQIPQWIATKYHETFKDGLLARMMMQPSKPYYHEVLAKYHGIRFRSEMNAAYVDMKQQNTFNAQAWVFPQNFITRRQ